MNTSSLAGFRVALGSFLIAWALFVAGFYQTTKNSSFELITYFLIAATAVFGIGFLIAKRRAAMMLGTDDVHAPSVHMHAIAGVIVAMVVSAWAVVALFVNLFVTQFMGVAERIVNTYVPIVLFTALLIVLLLFGFVFTAPARPSSAFPYPGSPAPEPQVLDRKTNALAFAIPIIGAAIAAITAGIIYDATGTSLTAWIWMIVIAILTAGLLVGTHYSSQLSRPAGAHGLNAAWAIALSAVVALMSLGYGVTTIDELRVYSSLSLNAYEQETGDYSMELSGNDLQPRSEVILTGVDGEELASGTVDRDGWVWFEAAHLAPFPEGDSQLQARALAKDGTELQVELGVTNDGGEVTFDEDGYVVADLNYPQKLTWQWFGSYLLPTFLMALTVVVVLYTTEVMRARTGKVRDNS